MSKQVTMQRGGSSRILSLKVHAVRPTVRVIEQVVAEVAGADVIPLVKILKNKKNVSEFVLAESIEQEINVTRNMLYRLYHQNLVTFTRKKDKQKGWYIYYWTFQPKRVMFLLGTIRKNRIEQLKDRLKKEQANFYYVCEASCMRLAFDPAMDFEFKCPECGGLMNQQDNSIYIQRMQEELVRLEGV